MKTTEQVIPQQLIERRVFALRLIYSVDGAREGTVLPLVESALRLGREAGPPPHASFADPRLSRQHAQLRALGPEGPHLLEDLGSTNGTWRNGQRVEQVRLEPGDLVRVGSTLLLYDDIRRLAGSGARGQGRLVFRSAALAAILARIERVAASDLAVLILGESGTGKELVAQEIHAQSGRKGPFLAVNCGALSPNLVESELFGHVRGAFTGASQASQGLFRAAAGGTLFLDEMGELPLDLQARLLRVIETGEVRAVGSAAVQRVDTRVVAATNVDLDRACAEGRFRGDLLARLDEVRLSLPPLRQRRDDVLPLWRHFALKHGGRSLELDADAAEALVLNPWRYNVRELERVVRLLLLEQTERSTLVHADLPAEYRLPAAVAPEPAVTGGALPEIERDPEGMRARLQAAPAPTEAELRELLAHFRGRVQAVADFVGRDRRQVYRWLDRLGLSAEAFRF